MQMMQYMFRGSLDTAGYTAGNWGGLSVCQYSMFLRDVSSLTMDRTFIFTCKQNTNLIVCC